MPIPLLEDIAKTGEKFLLINASLIPLVKSSSFKVPLSKYLFISSSVVSATFSINSVRYDSASAFSSAGISASVTFLLPVSP